MSSLARLTAPLAVATALAACSDPGADALSGSRWSPDHATPGPSATPAKDGGAPAPQQPGSALPRPDAGPGSTSSAAHQYFVTTAFPALSTSCGGCHTSGALGAPKFLAANAEDAYIALDNRSLIQEGSLLLTKGQHASGSAPALSGEALTATQAWLGMEAKERVGTAQPKNLLQIAADCGDQAKFPTQALTSLLTTKRNNENGDTCTGCQNTQCASCHLAGEASTMISDGRSTHNTSMLSFYRGTEGITRFIGIDGTRLVASNVFKVKSDATVADQRSPAIPKHPQFILDANRQAAIDAFAQDIVTKFAAGQCPGQK